MSTCVDPATAKTEDQRNALKAFLVADNALTAAHDAHEDAKRAKDNAFQGTDRAAKVAAIGRLGTAAKAYETATADGETAITNVLAADRVAHAVEDAVEELKRLSKTCGYEKNITGYTYNHPKEKERAIRWKQPKIFDLAGIEVPAGHYPMFKTTHCLPGYHNRRDAWDKVIPEDGRPDLCRYSSNQNPMYNMKQPLQFCYGFGIKNIMKVKKLRGERGQAPAPTVGQFGVSAKPQFASAGDCCRITPERYGGDYRTCYESGDCKAE